MTIQELIEKCGGFISWMEGPALNSPDKEHIGKYEICRMNLNALNELRVEYQSPDGEWRNCEWECLDDTSMLEAVINAAQTVTRMELKNT